MKTETDTMGVRRRQRIRHSECNRQLKWFGRTRTQSMRSRGDPPVVFSVETTLTTHHPVSGCLVSSTRESGQCHAGSCEVSFQIDTVTVGSSKLEATTALREWLDGTMHHGRSCWQ
ncbi:hypothetical protein [Oryza sativa Japonica Group]|uniref:Uncharacterized protein n=1 Tax=Oryza sativa subsp. japonica TaxID=39947 RepID=Q8S0G0_ORYSJ|nr:hypothetical protein DAI22_01g466500 [Oryza sativa Japonica Group]BAB90257.1 hypothetical protein [Oryza sativa Japonica Group]